MSASSSAVELATVQDDPTRSAGHRRVLSDPASVRSDAAGSDLTGAADLPPGSARDSSAAPMPAASDGGLSDTQDAGQPVGVQGHRRARSTEAVASCSQAMVSDSEAGGSGMESPAGVDSGMWYQMLVLCCMLFMDVLFMCVGPATNCRGCGVTTVHQVCGCTQWAQCDQWCHSRNATRDTHA